MNNRERRTQRLRQKLESSIKTTHIPSFELGDDRLDASKLAGTPWMPKGKAWPTCKSCKRPMMLIAQLALGDVPEREGRARDLVQVFHCGGNYECNDGDVTHSPGGRGVVLRAVATSSKHSGAHKDAAKAAARHSTPVRLITGWEAHKEYPASEDIMDLGVELDAKERRALADVSPRDGVKLLGWPMWIQHADWPECPTCDGRMELLLQLNSEHYIPWSFGDGLAYLTQCPSHPKRLAISWSYT